MANHLSSAQINMRPSNPSNINVQLLKKYPILNDYSDLKLNLLVQRNCAAMSTQQLSEQTRSEVSKVMLCRDDDGHAALKLSKVNNGIFVWSIGQHSSADKAGLRFGHQILQINGIPVTGMSIRNVRKILQTFSKNNINVVIRNRPLERSIILHKDHTGNVGFQLKNGEIINIVKGSPADCNGVLTDYRLLEVNGKYIIGMEDKEIEDMFTKLPDMITITVTPKPIYNHMFVKITSSLGIQ